MLSLRLGAPRSTSVMCGTRRRTLVAIRDKFTPATRG